MSWLYSQVLVEEFLEENSLDGEQYVRLSGNHTQQAYCSPDRMTVCSRLSRFGMTFKPLTESLGADLLMWYLADSRARTLVQQDEEPESKEKEAVCGNTWHESSAKFDLDTLSWKTHQCLFAEDLAPSSVILPRWGIMRDGECFQQPPLEPITKWIGFGLSQKMWLTPKASDTGMGEKSETFLSRMGDRSDQCAQSLAAQVNNPMTWPTPTAHNAKERGYPAGFNRVTQGLGTIVQRFPTPQASDHRDRGNMSNPSVQRRVDIGKQISLSQSVHPTSGQLNPTWVEWLMGWPLFWTSLDINVNPYYDSWHEAQQRTQASPKEIQSGIVRNVWWGIDPSATPQGRQPNQQRQDQCDDSLPTVPCEYPLFDRELGAREREASDLQDLRGYIQTKAEPEIEAMWQAGMPKGKRETIGRVAVGGKDRVDRLKAIGNGQVPLCAATAWRLLTQEL